MQIYQRDHKTDISWYEKMKIQTHYLRFRGYIRISKISTFDAGDKKMRRLMFHANNKKWLGSNTKCRYMLICTPLYIYAYLHIYANMLNMLNIGRWRYICIFSNICWYAPPSIYMHIYIYMQRSQRYDKMDISLYVYITTTPIFSILSILT